jgi:hypothetical protein
MTDASYPAPAGSPATAGARPSVLNAAFWLYLASIVVGVVATLLTAPAVQQAANRVGGSSQAATGAVIAVAIVSGLIGAVIWGLFLFFLRRDQQWARWVLGALTLLGLIALLGGAVVSPASLGVGFGLGPLREVLAVIAAVLTFLPASSAYLREVAARRRATRA